MKKVLFTAVAVIAFSFANAQDGSGSSTGVKFGAKAGLNMSNFGGDFEDTKAIFGFHAGAFAEIKISDKFSFQPELLYSTQGAKFDSSVTDLSGAFPTVEKENGEINLGYINIPLMAKYYATEKLFIEAGPQVGFLVSAIEDYNYSYTVNGVLVDSEVLDREDVKDNYETIDYGMNLGLGYYFTENISAGVRYNFGLSNILKDSGDFKSNNGVFQLSIGYKF